MVPRSAPPRTRGTAHAARGLAPGLDIRPGFRCPPQQAVGGRAPLLVSWWMQPSALAIAPCSVWPPLRVVLSAMAAGVALSGLRDLAAALGVRGAAWPWVTPP